MKFKIAPFITIFFLLIFIIGLNAQPIASFQAGINLSSLNGYKNYEENKPRIGLAANLLLDVPLSKTGFISIETGIGVSQQGMKHKRITEDLATRTTTNVKNKLDYLIIPLYVKENFENAYTKFGVYGGYLINVSSDYTSEIRTSGVSITEVTGSNEEFVANANTYDYGLTFGFGIINQLNRGSYRRRRGRRVIPVLQVDFKYNIGLAKIDAKGNTPDMNFTNRTFMISLTISSVPNK